MTPRTEAGRALDPVCECGNGCVMPHKHRHVEREAAAIDVEQLRAAMRRVGWSRRFVEGHAERLAAEYARLAAEPSEHSEAGS